MKNVLSFLTLSLILLFSSCEKEEAEIQTYDCTGLTPTYVSDIQAIMDANCATSGCHNASSQASGINLSTYESVVEESNRTRFLGSIQHLSGYSPMPRNQSQLSDTNIQLIYCWVENGQPE